MTMPQMRRLRNSQKMVSVRSRLRARMLRLKKNANHLTELKERSEKYLKQSYQT